MRQLVPALCLEPPLGRFRVGGGSTVEGSLAHVFGDSMLAAGWDLGWRCQLEQPSPPVVACASSQRGGWVPRKSMS